MRKVGSLKRALSKYRKSMPSVRVGVLEDATYPNGTSVAQAAFNNEYGTDRIPARPFFRTTVSNNRENWINHVKQFVYIHGSNGKALGLVGEIMKNNIVESILAWEAPPNAPLTIKKKGFNAPLRDTMQLTRSITYEVKDES